MMLAEIIRRTPIWVFILFFALLGLGLMQMRARKVSQRLVWVLPVAMVLLSAYGTISAFGLEVRSLLAWAAGAYFIFRWNASKPAPQGVVYHAASQSFAVPGSAVPLALMMAIFALKYFVGVTLARDLPFAHDHTFTGGVSFLYGCFSGAFAARAWRVLQVQPGVRWHLPTLPVARHLLLITGITFIGLLDLGRSFNAHFGYREPTEIWRPDPKQYAEIAWPPGVNTSAAADPGDALYQRYCSACHGPDGRGNGPGAPSMIPRPRDFTSGEFKYKSTVAGSPPSDQDLQRTIANGLQASGMPHFSDLLSNSEIDTLVARVKRFSKVFAHSATPEAIPVRPPVTAAAMQRGEKLYREHACVNCHGDDLRGGQELRDQKGYPVLSRDLTAPWTYRGGASPGEVYLRLTTGMLPGPMPAFTQLSIAQRWDLVAYLESKWRIAPWEPGGVLAGPAQSGDPAVRGRALVRAGMCGLCHTEVSERDVYRDDHYLAGGMLVGAYPQGMFVSANLTSDAETGLGAWSAEEIARAIRLGRGRSGHLLNIWGMPWMYLHHYSKEDALAIAHYLKTLPAVHHEIPRPVHYGVVETIVAKLYQGDVFPARAEAITYAVGSYANLPGWRPDRAEAWLAAAQFGVLVLLLLLAPLGRSDAARQAQGRVRRLAVAAVIPGLVVAVGAGTFVYHSPNLAILPPDRMAQGAGHSIPQPAQKPGSPQVSDLVARGREVFSFASCPYCHQNDGSGGFKISGNGGSIYVPNISSDPKAGIGRWSDAQIARAIRAGISRDGRVLWWQGMPWDHYSSFPEEEVRAVIAYLRTLPPVSQPVPAYQPPTPADCKVYTFWTVRNEKPGCQ